MWHLWWTKWHWGNFLRVLRFPLPIFIPPAAPQSPLSIIRGWYNRPIVAPIIIIIIIIIIIKHVRIWKEEIVDCFKAAIIRKSG
jgi:hypothetical protein